MKITLRDIRVENTNEMDPLREIQILSTVVIDAFGDCYEERNVDLFVFYRDFKNAITDALLSGINSHISIDHEPLLELSQSESGVLAKNILVNNPAFSSIEYEEVELVVIRRLIFEIESHIASHISPFRNTLITRFDHTGSKDIFDLLKLIDRSNTIHP